MKNELPNDVGTGGTPAVAVQRVVMPPSQEFKVGDEIHLEVKGVTYQCAGEIVEIRGQWFATVRYKQPWAPWHNCMRETIVDLRHAKKINRRKPKAA